MNRVSGFFSKFRVFLFEVQAELKKCAWPARSELLDSTVVVIVSVLILGFYVAVCDWVSVNLLKFVIR